MTKAIGDDQMRVVTIDPGRSGGWMLRMEESVGLGSSRMELCKRLG